MSVGRSSIVCRRSSGVGRVGDDRGERSILPAGFNMSSTGMLPQDHPLLAAYGKNRKDQELYPLALGAYGRLMRFCMLAYNLPGFDPGDEEATFKHMQSMVESGGRNGAKPPKQVACTFGYLALADTARLISDYTAHLRGRPDYSFKQAYEDLSAFSAVLNWANRKWKGITDVNAVKAVLDELPFSYPQPRTTRRIFEWPVSADMWDTRSKIITRLLRGVEDDKNGNGRRMESGMAFAEIRRLRFADFSPGGDVLFVRQGVGREIKLPAALKGMLLNWCWGMRPVLNGCWGRSLHSRGGAPLFVADDGGELCVDRDDATCSAERLFQTLRDKGITELLRFTSGNPVFNFDAALSCKFSDLRYKRGSRSGVLRYEDYLRGWRDLVLPGDLCALMLKMHACFEKTRAGERQRAGPAGARPLFPASLDGNHLVADWRFGGNKMWPEVSL